MGDACNTRETNIEVRNKRNPLMWGRLLIQPGLASTSISIDGISESMGTTQSARYSAMSAEIAR